MYKYTNGDISYNMYYDKRTNKNYERYSFKTYVNEGFTEIYNLWYKNNVKIIPKNLKLNKIICLIWYIGDGSLVTSKRTQYIKLATNCFTKEDQENILLPQLS